MKSKVMKSVGLSYILIVACVSMTGSCRKVPADAEYFIKCKLDGRPFVPNNCANCMRGQIPGDTVFLLNANAGFETVSLGIIKLDRVPITVATYVLNDNPQQSVQYDKSPRVDNIYKTDGARTGTLMITSLIKLIK